MDSIIGSCLAIGGPGYMNLALFVEVFADRLFARNQCRKKELERFDVNDQDAVVRFDY